MRLLLVALFCICFSYVDAKISYEKRREILVKSLTECKTKENGSDNDLARLLATEYPETLQGRCMIACVLEDFVIVSWNKPIISWTWKQFFLISSTLTENLVEKRFCTSQVSLLRRMKSSWNMPWNWPTNAELLMVKGVNKHTLL